MAVESSWDQAWQQVADPTSAPVPMLSPTQQPASNVAGHTKTKADFAGDAEQAQNPEQGTGVGEYAWDAAVGVAAGAEGFAKSIGKLTNDVAGLFGLQFADDSAFENRIHTKTWVGGLTSGLTQFALGFVPALGLAGRLGTAVGVTSKLVQGLAAGAAADFVGFSEKQERLSNLVQQFPSLRNPVTDYLSSKPDDNWAEGRLKASLEGMGLSAALEPFMARPAWVQVAGTGEGRGDKAAFARPGLEGRAKTSPRPSTSRSPRRQRGRERSRRSRGHRQADRHRRQAREGVPPQRRARRSRQQDR
jgi:hypothetical protein